MAHVVDTATEKQHERALWSEFLRTLTFPNHVRAFVFTLMMMVSGFMVIPYISLYMTSNMGLPETQLPWCIWQGASRLFLLRAGSGVGPTTPESARSIGGSR